MWKILYTVSRESSNIFVIFRIIVFWINVFFRKNRNEGDRLFINSHTFLCKDYPRNRKVAFPYHLQANISIIKGRI